MPLISNHRSTQGFTLVELAIVLVIIAFLTGGLMMGITAQRASAENSDAQRQLDNIREALIGFAMANGRLPCPADPVLTSVDATVGLEDRANTNSPCNREYGVIPWVTLGLPETDPWGRRFTYFSSSKFTAPQATGSLSSFTLYTGSIHPTTGVDDSAGLANVKDDLGNTSKIASDLPAVIVSHGANGFGGWQPNGTQFGAANGNELENANLTQTFVARTPGSNFDDLLVWIAPSVLKSRMVAAGNLP